jgi:hypothetical protein
MVGGSADVVSGAYEHTINMQAKNQPIVAFVLQGRAPQIVLAVNNKTMPNYKGIADLKGKKIGVTAPAPPPASWPATCWPRAASSPPMSPSSAWAPLPVPSRPSAPARSMPLPTWIR